MTQPSVIVCCEVEVTQPSVVVCSEVEKMKKDLEEEIRAQLLANQEMLAGAEGTGMSWEEKVQQFKMAANKINLATHRFATRQDTNIIQML